MKKITVLVFILLIIYLNRAYAHFYATVGKLNLQPPKQSDDLMLNPQSSKKIVYVALGDSLTKGVGATDYHNAYPYLLAEHLSMNKQVELINLSNTGATSKDLLENQVHQALNDHPDLVTVFVGINDIHNLISPDQYRSSLDKTIGDLSASKARIYLFTLPNLGSSETLLPPYNLLLTLRTTQFNGVIKDVAKRYGVVVIDLSSDNTLYSPDGFHPSDDGYLMWSSLINANINL